MICSLRKRRKSHHKLEALLTSSSRLCPSKVKGFKIIATENPLADLIVLRISIAAMWSEPYPAPATWLIEEKREAEGMGQAPNI